MSLTSLSMDDLDREQERTRAEPAPKARWSARRTLAFVVIVSAALWALIIAAVLHLH